MTYMRRTSELGGGADRRRGLRARAGRLAAAMLVLGMVLGGLGTGLRAEAAYQSSVEGTLAWLWANEPESDSYTPDTRYQFNSTGAENTVTRNGTGEYTATFPGVGREEGAFHVTGQGVAASCTIARWVLSGSDMSIDVRCFGADGSMVDSGFSAFYYIPAGNREGAFLWANEPESDSYTPDTRYQYNSTGAENTVTRTGTGEYTATLPGVGVEAGGFHVTGQGVAMSCTIARWVLRGADMDVEVRCFGSDGSLVDSGFIVTYGTAIFETPGAYLWANEPSTDSYTPDTRYQGSSSGAEGTVTRSETGVYTATFPGVGEESGNFLVTGQGAAASCTVARWVLSGSDMSVDVRCFGADGSLVDSGFLVSYNKAQ